jgi:hypothetical protein
MFEGVAATPPEEEPVHFISLDTAWQLRNDRRDRFMADASRRRRLRPRPPVDHLPDPPDRAA